MLLIYWGMEHFRAGWNVHGIPSVYSCVSVLQSARKTPATGKGYIEKHIFLHLLKYWLPTGSKAAGICLDVFLRARKEWRRNAQSRVELQQAAGMQDADAPDESAYIWRRCR